MFNLTAQLYIQKVVGLQQAIKQVQAAFKQLVLPTIGRNQVQALQAIAAAARRTQSNVQGTTAAIQQLTAAQAQLRSVGTGVVRVQNNMAQSAANLTRASLISQRAVALLTLRTAGLFAVLRGTRDAIDFERKLASIATVAGTSTDAIRPFGKELQTLSKQLGVSRDDLASMSEDLLQAGFSLQTVSKLTSSLGRLSLTPSFGDPEKLTKTVVLLREVFDVNNVSGFEDVLEKINRLSVETASEATDLASVLSKAGATLKGTNNSLQDLLALAATGVSSTQLPGNVVGRALKTIASRASSKENATKVRDLLGIDLSDAQGIQKPIVEIVRELAAVQKAFPKGSVSFSQGLEALAGKDQVNVLRALVDNVADLEANLETAGKTGNSVALAVANAQSTLQNQLERTKASFQELFNAIVSDRGLRDFAQAALGVAQSLSQILQELRPLIPLIAAIGAAKGLQALMGLAGGRLSGLAGGLIQTGAYGAVGINKANAFRLGAGAVALGGGLVGAQLANQGGNAGVAGQSILGGVSGGLLGSVLGPWGAAIGATTGIIIAWGKAVEDATEKQRTASLGRATAELQEQVDRGLEADPAVRNATFMRELLALRESQRTAGDKGFGGFVLDALKNRANYNMAGYTFFPEVTPAGQAANTNVRANEALQKAAPAITGYLQPEFEKILQSVNGDTDKFDAAIQQFTDELGPLATNIIPLIKSTADAVRGQARAIKAQEDQAEAIEKTVDVEKQLQATQRKLVDALSRYIDATTSLTNEQLNQVNLRAAIAKGNVGLQNLPASEAAMALAGLEENQFRGQQAVLGGGLDAAGLSGRANNLLQQITGTRAKLNALPEEGSERERSILEGSLAILNQQLDQTSAALRSLADGSAAYATQVERLNQLQASQNSRLDLGKRFLSSDAQGRAEIIGNNFVAQRAVAAGNLDFSQLNPLQRIEAQQRALQGLQDLGGTLIDFQGKKRPANEVLDELVKNSRDVAPFLKQPLDEARAAKAAEDEIRRRQDEQLKAQQALVDLQKQTWDRAGADMRNLAEALRAVAGKPNALAGGNQLPQLPAALPMANPDAIGGGQGADLLVGGMSRSNEAFAESVNGLVVFNKGFDGATNKIGAAMSVFSASTNKFEGAVNKFAEYLEKHPLPSEIEHNGTMTFDINVNGSEALAAIEAGVVKVFEREWAKKMERQYNVRMNSPFPNDEPKRLT